MIPCYPSDHKCIYIPYLLSPELFPPGMHLWTYHDPFDMSVLQTDSAAHHHLPRNPPALHLTYHPSCHFEGHSRHWRSSPLQESCTRSKEQLCSDVWIHVVGHLWSGKSNTKLIFRIFNSKTWYCTPKHLHIITCKERSINYQSIGIYPAC